MVVRERYYGISFLIEDRLGGMDGLLAEGSESAREPMRIDGRGLSNR
jgi:hypothetical protein